MKIKYYLLILTLGSYPAFSRSLLNYNPLVLNLATLFDFNAIKGNVKSIHSIGKDDTGKINYESNLSLDKSGCIETFNVNNFRIGYKIVMRRFNTIDKDILGIETIGDSKSSIVTFRINDKCQIISKNGQLAEFYYTYNNSGLLDKIFINASKKPISEYNYDDGIFPITTHIKISDKINLETNLHYESASEKPFNYKVKQTLGNNENQYSETFCQYDKNLNPTECSIKLSSDENFKRIISVQKLITEATFY